MNDTIRPIIEVEQGAIHVNHVWLVVCDPNSWVIQADLRAKRASVCALSGMEIYLGGDEDTREMDLEVDKFSVVKLPNIPKGWSLHAKVSRYTLTIFAFLQLLPETDVDTMLWSDDLDDHT